MSPTRTEQTGLAAADVTPAQIRMARALLAWSQRDLAESAKVDRTAVATFERGQQSSVADLAQTLRSAVEAAGVQFPSAGDVLGPAIAPLTPSERPGTPIRWVNAEDLATWASRIDGIASLPTLIAHLIRATHGEAIHIRFPSDEGTRYSGWDGYSSTDLASTYVPTGKTGWEFGNQRSRIAQKADEDYKKRTIAPAPLDPADAAFIFVTPQHWPQKDAWAEARQAAGPWREVRAYDANDLVHWIEQTPSVGLWLATRLGKRPPGLRQLEDVWQEWSLATEWPLTEDLVLSDRDEDAAEILRWLRRQPSVLSMQATTTEEAVAFFHATVGMLPERVTATYRTRCLVTTDAAEARALANSPAPLIIVLTEPAPGVAGTLVDKGHYVLQTYDERPISHGKVRALARPSREGIEDALIAGGIAKPKACALARDSARNLAVLRRLIPSAPGRLPAWAQQPPGRALLAAMLAGGWDERKEADRARVAELAELPYADVIAAIVPFVSELDSPLRKVGSTWRIASPPDAWFLLAPHLTSSDIARFESVAHVVLEAVDPRFEMNPDDRWMAPVHGVHPEYSTLLRHGVGETLILLALWGDKIKTVPGANRRTDAIVGRLFHKADQRRWWSLSHDFRRLAEASPDAFLTAIENSLDQDEPPIRALFGTDRGGVCSTEYLSDLLWALESLAWSRDLMPRVTYVLARLDAIDNPPGQYANRPANSLREIHLLWNPQTFSGLDDRLRAIDLIRKREPDAAWKLMLSVLPKGYDMCTPSAMPRWRDFTENDSEVITQDLIRRGALAITERLVSDVGLHPARWQVLLDRLNDLAPEPNACIAALEAAESNFTDEAERAALWTSLREQLHRHRKFPDAEWALALEFLDRLEAIYRRLAPDDPFERVAWLFGTSVELPDPTSADWEDRERQLETSRVKAASAVLLDHGIDGVLELAAQASAPGYIGTALVAGGLAEAELDALLAAALRSDDAHAHGLARGLIVRTFPDRRETWAEGLIRKARDDGWGDAALLAILDALPTQRWTWDQAALAGEKIETAYWRRAPVYSLGDKSAEYAFATRKLISVGRARHALELLGHIVMKMPCPTDLLVETLREAVHQPVDYSGDSGDNTMFQYYVAEIMKVLDDRPDLDTDTLTELEWTYLPLLEHSARPPKVLCKALSENPALFIQMLSAVFNPTEESSIVDPEHGDPEHARIVAQRAFSLLEAWNRLPGTQEDGSIDADVLEAWIKESRSLAKAAGREGVADSRIGTMLSASPVGADRNWPTEAVRHVIDLFRSDSMLNGFEIGKANRRGVTSRMPRDGGQLERDEAAKYRTWAAAIAFDYPYTAKALRGLADSYERDARRHDEDAERLDWES